MKRFKTSDKIIKDKLEHYDSGAPMHLFDRIEAELADKSEKKPKGGYWIFALALLCVGGLGWMLISNNTSTEIATNDITDKKETSAIVTTTESVADATLTNNKIQEEHFTKKITPEKTKGNNKIKTVETKITKTAKTEFAKTEKPNSAKTNTSNDAILISNSKSSELQTTSTQINTTTAKEDFYKKGIPSQLASVENKNLNSSQLVNSTFLNKNEVTVQPTLKEQISAITLLENRFSLLENKHNSASYLPEIKCGTKGKTIKVHTDMDLFVSPEHSFRFLEYKTDDFADYAQKRNDTEKAYYSFSTGMRLSFYGEKNNQDLEWKVRTGIVYSQINEIFETQYVETTIKTNPVTGDTLGYDQQLRDVTTFNRYKMIDVPVLFGYEIPMKKATINVNAGVYVNVSAMQKGAFLSPDNEQRVDFNSEGNNSYFRKNVGLSYYMSVGAAYKLNNQYQFFFEPHLRYYPTSFTRSEYVLNQKYISGGIMFGIRKKLN